MIIIGSDHGDVELKDFLVEILRLRGAEVEDVGTQGNDSVDYPDYGSKVAMKVAKGDVEQGILICTSGIGMTILANKFPGVRAALVHDLRGAQMSREHNNANILVLGGGVTEKFVAQKIVDLWLETPFAGGRHQRRLEKIAQIELELGISIERKTK